MSHITLTVTAKALQQAAGATNQQQLAIRSASPNVQRQISAARKGHPVVIPINGEFDLAVGDTSAIWHSHQSSPSQQADFADLYALLSRRPDRDITFRW